MKESQDPSRDGEGEEGSRRRRPQGQGGGRVQPDGRQNLPTGTVAAANGG